MYSVYDGSLFHITSCNRVVFYPHLQDVWYFNCKLESPDGDKNAEYTLAARSLAAFLKHLAMLDAEEFADNGVMLSLGGVERCVVSVYV